MELFKGIITPIITPFYDDEEQNINYAAADVLIDSLIAEGVSGIFVLGSNGEFHVLDQQEKIDFVKHVVKHVNHRVPVYAGAGSCSTKKAILLAEAFEKAGADALSVISPYFIAPGQEDLYEHYARIAESTSLPILLYNIPKNTGCTIRPELADRLADIDNIKGIKDSSGNLELLQAYADIAAKKDFALLVGSDSKISDAYKMGASGAVAGTSNVIPSILVRLDQALRNGAEEEAEKLQKSIDLLRSVLPLASVPAVMKRAVELSGRAEAGPARRPVRPVDQEADEKIIAMLQTYGLHE